MHRHESIDAGIESLIKAHASASNDYERHMADAHSAMFRTLYELIISEQEIKAKLRTIKAD